METSPSDSTLPDSDCQDPVQDAVDAAADDAQARLWLRALVPLLQCRSTEQDGSPRVQKALDRMFTAAADRATRILRADMLD